MPELRAARRGRPLDAGVDESILAAAMELLYERGYDQLTVKEIAERAGAGLGAIYRRWPTKLAVVVAALQARDSEAPLQPCTGDTAEDLSRALLHDVASVEHRIPGLVSALRHEPDLAAAVRDALVIPRQQAFAHIFAAAFDDPAECELRAEMAVAILLHRLMLGTALPDEREIRERLVPLLLGQPLATRQ